MCVECCNKFYLKYTFCVYLYFWSWKIKITMSNRSDFFKNLSFIDFLEYATNVFKLSNNYAFYSRSKN